LAICNEDHWSWLHMFPPYEAGQTTTTKWLCIDRRLAFFLIIRANRDLIL
jgi:hypothetical protein